MLPDLSPNSIASEFDGRSRLSDLEPDERRAEITLCIVGFVLIFIQISNLNMVLQHGRAIYFLPCPSPIDKKIELLPLNHRVPSLLQIYIKFCYNVLHLPKLKINICTRVNMSDSSFWSFSQKLLQTFRVTI